jgi:hypothetical protein
MEEHEEYGTAARSTHLQEYVPLPKSTFYLGGAPLATLGVNMSLDEEKTEQNSLENGRLSLENYLIACYWAASSYLSIKERILSYIC